METISCAETLCGGCDMMGIDEQQQVDMRKSLLKDAFFKAFSRAGLDTHLLPSITAVTGDAFNYRARVQLDGGAFHKYHSTERAAVHNCIVATAEINEYLSEIEKEISIRKLPFIEGRCQVFGDRRVVPGKNGRKVIVCNTASNIPPSESTEVCVELDTSIGRKRLKFDVRGFFQSNLGMLERAVPLVCGGLSGHNLLDMYAGCGTFSAFLTDNADEVTLVEKDTLGITYAEVNMAGRAHKSFALSGRLWVKFHGDETLFDAAILDPPRAGLEKEVLQYFISHPVPIVRYLSCNAITHARDVAALAAGGYAIHDLALLDFYPQTHRTESLATLYWEK